MDRMPQVRKRKIDIIISRYMSHNFSVMHKKRISILRRPMNIVAFLIVGLYGEQNEQKMQIGITKIKYHHTKQSKITLPCFSTC